MDIIETLRDKASRSDLAQQAALEIERLRAQNEILKTAMECASTAMASAPIWHGQHRVMSEVLIDLKRKLARLEQEEMEQAASPA